MTKTLEKIRSRFYWPGQRKDVEDLCKRCEMCASRKSPSTKRRAPLQSDLTGCPLQRVAMDILGPLPLTDRGNKYVLVVGDYFTKWVEAYPMSNMEAGTVAELFCRVLCASLVCQTFFTPIMSRKKFRICIAKGTVPATGSSQNENYPLPPSIRRFGREIQPYFVEPP